MATPEQVLARFQGRYEYAEKRSTFIFLCLITDSREEFQRAEREVKEAFPKAAHILSVARIRDADGIYEAASENGEPVKAAHKTLFGLTQRGVEDIGLLAIRHYGGKKLGASNLDGIFTMGFQAALRAAGR